MECKQSYYIKEKEIKVANWKHQIKLKKKYFFKGLFKPGASLSRMFPFGSTLSRNSAEYPAYFNRFSFDGFGIDRIEVKESAPEELGPNSSLLFSGKN